VGTDISTEVQPIGVKFCVVVVDIGPGRSFPLWVYPKVAPQKIRNFDCEYLENGKLQRYMSNVE